MDDIEKKKRELRAFYIKKRAELHDAERDEAIAARVLRAFSAAESFFVYVSVRTEVSTRALIRALLAAGKKVRLPRTVGKELAALPFSDRLIANAYGIPEPREGEDGECDVTLTPLLAFDKEGYRLGYGGGYYDRYFARRPATLRVGLAYAGQAAEALPRSETDVPLQTIITEELPL